MDVDVLVERLEARPIMTARTTRPPSDVGPALGELLPRVRSVMAQQGAAPAGPPLTIYHRFGQTDVDFEAGFTAPRMLQDDGDVVCREAPAGLAAVAIHEGVYDSVHRTHSAIQAWIAREDYEVAGPPSEEYLVGAQDTDDPQKWRTRISWPIVEV